MCVLSKTLKFKKRMAWIVSVRLHPEEKEMQDNNDLMNVKKFKHPSLNATRECTERTLFMLFVRLQMYGHRESEKPDRATIYISNQIGK